MEGKNGEISEMMLTGEQGGDSTGGTGGGCKIVRWMKDSGPIGCEVLGWSGGGGEGGEMGGEVNTRSGESWWMKGKVDNYVEWIKKRNSGGN